MKKIGFIFDLDGVIVDTAKYHYRAWKTLADELGIPFSEEQNEQFKGVSRKRCLEILLDMGEIKASQNQKDAWLKEKNEAYLNYIEKMDTSEILPDVIKVLDHLRDLRIPMALGSASKNARPILEKVKLLTYFDAIIDGNSVTKAKPDPEVFMIAAKNLEAAPINCVVFEDARAGIAAANTAGMISIGIGEAEVLSEANYNFENFTQIDIDFLNTLIAELSNR